MDLEYLMKNSLFLFLQQDSNNDDINNSNDDIPFCVESSMMGGGGEIMYMDGFHFTLARGNPCLNLYFPSWTLDTPTKFWCAMIGVILLGVVTEGISKLRSLVHQNHSTIINAVDDTNNKMENTNSSTKRWCITFFHGLQAFVGYILMLATMTFSAELFFCVIFGLVLGYAIFFTDEDLHATTNPCCNFIQDESFERASTLRRISMAEQQQAKEEEEALLSQQTTSEIEQQQQEDIIVSDENVVVVEGDVNSDGGLFHRMMMNSTTISNNSNNNNETV